MYQDLQQHAALIVDSVCNSVDKQADHYGHFEGKFFLSRFEDMPNSTDLFNAERLHTRR